MTRIAIIGGHGKVALRLSSLLADRGHQVTSLFRDPEQTDEVRETGATPVVLDVEESTAEEIARRIEGHDALVWSAGAGGGNPARTYAVDRDAAIRSMEAADRAGVDRYIMVSYLGASLDHGVPEDDPFFAYAEAKAAADDYLRNTALDWTILGPGRLTLDEPTGRIAVGTEIEEAGRETSRGNVARVAVAVLGEPRTIGTTIDFVDGETPIGEAIVRTGGN
jgi:nucleoside-diphosphate-sugar epimerase